MAKRITDISQLSTDIRNANKGTVRGRGMVEASLREVGAGRSIVADREGRIIAGNKTLEAAADIGLKIKVVETDGQELVVVQRNDLDLSDDTGQARKLAYYDNRASETGLAWDAEQLLADLNAGVSFDGLFDQAELDALLAGLVKPEPVTDPGPQLDKAQELLEKWQCKTGQIWQMGRHRLICGDCTDKATVERLMGGEKAVLMLTDPPYGVDYGELVRSRENQKKVGWADIQNDALSDDDLFDLLKNSLHGCGATVGFVWHPAGARRWLFWKAAEENGWRIAQEIVWVKNALVFGRADYQWRHEPCLYLKREGAPRQEDRTQTTVWEVNKPTDSVHPTMKPIELFSISINNHTKQNDIVYEPFSGSGTTLIACEQLSRQCRAVEISPAYCSVTLERFFVATGTKPVLIADATGQTPRKA